MCVGVALLWQDRRRRRRLRELRNQGEEVWTTAVECLKAKRVRTLLAHAERALTDGRVHPQPYELGCPLSYSYSRWQVTVHRLRDPKVRDARLGITVPSFRGELFSHQHQALESEQRAAGNLSPGSATGRGRAQRGCPKSGHPHPRASPPLPLLRSRFCTSLWMNRVNGMLCDAPGLGKTSVAIAYMTYLADRHRFKGPFLVVCADDSLKTWNDMLHWHAAGAGRGAAGERKKGTTKEKRKRQTKGKHTEEARAAPEADRVPPVRGQVLQPGVEHAQALRRHRHDHEHACPSRKGKPRNHPLILSCSAVLVQYL